MKWVFAAVAGGCLTVAACAARADYVVKSPRGQVVARVAVGSELSYTVDFAGKPLLVRSPLGLELERGGLLGNDMRVLDTRRRSVNETWKPVAGKFSTVTDRCNELVLSLRENSLPLREMAVVVRAYDDGVAIRYLLTPQESMERATITRENTGFRFSGDPDCWASDYGSYTSPYESPYIRRPLSNLSEKSIVGLPLLIHARPDAWCAVTEADLTDWPGLYVAGAPGAQGTTGLGSKLSPRVDGGGVAQVSVPHASPWRVILVAKRPVDLTASEIVDNVSRPSAIRDASWIKPGMMAWDRWWTGVGGADTATDEKYVRFASEMGFPYQLVDGGWYGESENDDADITRPVPSLDMPALLRYAKQRNVRLWLWMHWSDVERHRKAGRLDADFALFEQWGIAGLKIDFMNRDDQEMVNWYETVLKAAADHHLMVLYHGAYKPTGLSRTWPNLLNREGVMGNEYNKFGRAITPEHTVTLPFTRMLAGPMDFTPGGFLNRSPAEFKVASPAEVMGTRCHQLAMFVVYEHPLCCVCDSPENYANQPGLAFLKAVKTTWDETRPLEGEVGRHILLARRSGSDWFLGGMAGNEAYAHSLPLSFLGKGRFRAHIFADAPDSATQCEHLAASAREVTAKASLPVNMVSGGGVAVWFEHLP